MDDSIGDIKNTILDAQKAILYQVEEAILGAELELHALNDALATLDAVISLGTLALENGFVRPVGDLWSLWRDATLLFK